MPEGSTGWGDQGALSRFRSAADQARYYENLTDVDVFDDPRYQHFYQTGEYRPSSQAFPDEEIQGANFGQGRAMYPDPRRTQETPTQAWNATPVPAPVAPPVVALPNPDVGQPTDTGPTGGTGTESEAGRQLMELLMGRARQATAVGRDDPNVRAQVDPLTAQMERANRNYLDSLAERGMGRPINLQGEQRLAAERLGQQAGTLESEVIGREIGARRQDIQMTLAQWGDLLSADQRVALERELGYLSDRARTSERTDTMDRFLRELAMRQWMFEDESAYRWAGL